MRERADVERAPAAPVPEEPRAARGRGFPLGPQDTPKVLRRTPAPPSVRQQARRRTDRPVAVDPDGRSRASVPGRCRRCRRPCRHNVVRLVQQATDRRSRRPAAPGWRTRLPRHPGTLRGREARARRWISVVRRPCRRCEPRRCRPRRRLQPRLLLLPRERPTAGPRAGRTGWFRRVPGRPSRQPGPEGTRTAGQLIDAKPAPPPTSKPARMAPTLPGKRNRAVLCGMIAAPEVLL